MKSKKLNLFLIFTSAFLISFIVTYNYLSPKCEHKIQGIVGMIIFFLLTIGGIKYNLSRFKPWKVMLLILSGSLIFLLPYSLLNLPWQVILLQRLVDITIGIILGYLFFIYKSIPARMIIIIILVLFALFNFCCAFDYLWNNFVVNIS